MGLLPEREKLPVNERSEEATPLTIERKEVATPIPVQFRSQVKSDSGQPLITTPATNVKQIIIPRGVTELTEASKGSISDAITWFAAFWLRMIKKAVYFGWRILSNQK